MLFDVAVVFPAALFADFIHSLEDYVDAFGCGAILDKSSLARVERNLGCYLWLQTVQDYLLEEFEEGI